MFHEQKSIKTKRIFAFKWMAIIMHAKVPKNKKAEWLHFEETVEQQQPLPLAIAAHGLSALQSKMRTFPLLCDLL